MALCGAGTMTTITNMGGFQAIVIASALELYAATGMKANSAYTPRNMMAAATRITGQKFKPRDYLGAAEALRAYRKIATMDGSPMR